MKKSDARNTLLTRLRDVIGDEPSLKPDLGKDDNTRLETLVEELLQRYQSMLKNIDTLAKGSLQLDEGHPTAIPAPVKILHTRLSHLIWQTRELSRTISGGRSVSRHKTAADDTVSANTSGDSTQPDETTDCHGNRKNYFDEFATFHNSITNALEECRHLGQELSANNRKQHILINTLPAYIYFKDTQLRYQLVNEAYAGIIGLAPEQIIGKCDAELPFDKSVNIYAEIDRTIIETGKAQCNIIKEHHDHHGIPYWSSTSKVPYCDSEGKVIGIIGIVTDITEQKKAEQALIESEKKYRLIAENTLDVIWILDLNTMRFTYVSPSVQAMRGYTPQEAMDQLLSDTLTPASYDYAVKTIRESLELAPHDPQFNLRFRIQQPCKDGHTVDVEAVATFIRDTKGIPSGILGISRDISTHVKIEEQSELIKLLLREFEENAGDWLWEIDGEGKLSYVSVRFAQLFRKTSEQLIGTSFVGLIADTFDTEDEEGTKRLRSFSRRIMSPSPFREFMLTVQIDKIRRWWMLTGKPLIGKDGTMQGWRGVGRDVTERKRHEEETERQANIDALTGLANRYYLHKFFQGYFIAVDRFVSRCALLHFSIDNLKVINAIFGHSAGETIIQKVAERMKKISREKEVLVARIAREEFAAFFMTPANNFDLEALQFIESVCMPVTLGSESLDVRASAGYVVFPDAYGDSEATPERIFQCAEMAFETAKDEGQHGIRAYDRDLSERELHRLAIINELSKALERNEFRLVYQPQIDVGTGLVKGVESLLRWDSPVLGTISPEEFIPLAEQNGMMVEIGKWILLQACKDAINWPLPLLVAVNVSSGQFMSNSFLDSVAVSLDESGLNSQRLKLEITESSIIGNSAQVKEYLTHLRGKGIKIALDDFGTGYSSLSYLRTFPIDELKIDQSFVRSMERDPGSIAIVESIIKLAKTLNMLTTAEGVETKFEEEYLRHFGCDTFQGFLYSKPLLHTEIMKLNA